MDREIAPEVRRRKTARRIAAVAIAIAAIVFSFAATIQWLRPSVRRSDLQIARVERGAVDATLQASGTTMPAVEQVVSSPVDARVLRIIRRAGDHVRAGDELVALDTTATQLDVDRLAGNLATKESEQAQLRLKLEETIANLRAQIEQKKLDREIVAYKAAQTAKLRHEGLVSEQDNLAAETGARKADIELAQLTEALGRAQRTGEAQMAASATDLATLRRERDESQRQLQLAMMRADRGGVVTMIVQDAGATIHRGDVVARIADLSSYRVDATISDVHAADLAAGMPVHVRVDDATTLEGVISSVDPRVDSGTAKFHVTLADGSNAKLRSNIHVDVFVVTGRRENVLRVRRGALGQAARDDVFVVRGDSIVRVPVRWGLAGEDYIEPVGGALREGDEVVISNMSDYEGATRLRLK